MIVSNASSKHGVRQVADLEIVVYCACQVFVIDKPRTKSVLRVNVDHVTFQNVAFHVEVAQCRVLQILPAAPVKGQVSAEVNVGVVVYTLPVAFSVSFALGFVVEGGRVKDDVAKRVPVARDVRVSGH